MRQHPWRLIWKTVRAHWLLALVLVALSMLLSFAPVLKSALEAAVINEVDDALQDHPQNLSDAFERPIDRLSGGSENGGVEGFFQDLAALAFSDVPLWGAIASYAVIALVAYGLAVAITTARARVTQSFFGELRGEGMRKALLVQPSDPDLRNEPGHYANAVQQGAASLSHTYSFWLEAGQYVFAFITTSLVIWSKSYLFGVFILVAVAIQVGVTALQARRLRGEREKLDQKRNDLVARSDDILSKRDILLAHERHEHYGSVLRGLSMKYAGVERGLSRREEIFQGFARMTSDVGRLGILAVALLIAVTARDEGVSSIGDAYFLIALYARMLAPAQNLLNRYDDMRRSQATSQTFLRLLRTPTDVHAPITSADSHPSSVDDSDIRFSEVYFSYRSGENVQPVLRGCTFHVPARKTTLLLGRSATGKTTIARILLGFLEPDRGSIAIAGRPLAAWTPAELRAEMSYVSQGDHVVDDTVRENFLTDRVDDDTMIRLLKNVHLLRANDPPGRGKEVLASDAKKLSIGQQQRLALARMLADNAPIVIMDEPLTGLDVFTFRDLHEELTSFLRAATRTVLMVSHRLAFAAYADHIVVLDPDGTVSEEGSRDELLSRGGEFAGVYQAALDELTGEPSLRRYTRASFGWLRQVD